MKNYIIVAVALLGLAATATISIQSAKIRSLKDDRDRYRGNTETLMQDLRRYKISDSLNEARTGILELKLSEYERYRAEDAALINLLRRKNEDLQEVAKTQTETIDSLKLQVRDSVVILSGDTIQVQKVDYSDKWLDFHAQTYKDSMQVSIAHREELVLTEFVEYKRFLCFLWKTKKIKSRDFSVVSRNPNTKIVSVEVVRIEK